MDLSQVPVRDLALILDGSLVRLGASVMYCRGIADGKVHLKSIITQEETTIPVEGVSAIIPYLGPLGYINTDHGASYLTRKPRRQTRAGLTTNNVTCLMPQWLRETGRADYIVRDAQRGLTNELILQPRDNNYPSLEVALSKSTRRESLFAYTRFFAVDMYRKIYYRNKEVGKYEDGNVIFMDKFSLLEGVHLC